MNTKGKVLVIDDEEIIVNLFKRFLPQQGYECHTASNGSEGLKAIKEIKPYIVFLDLKMPGMDGIEVLRRIKKGPEKSVKTEVIIITAYGEVETAIMALREGLVDYIKKPVDLGELELALGRAKERIDEYKKVKSFPTLLLAEDDISARQLLSRTLGKEGWQIFESGDGEQALEIFQERKVDIALMDIKMPKIGGLTVMGKMREITDDFEAIIFTGYGDESTIIKAMRTGVANFLKKPIDLDELMLVLAKALEKLNLRRSLKYRTRELALAKEVIASVTVEREIVVDVRERATKLTQDFVQNLLDAIPMGILVLDREMRVRHVNKHVGRIFDSQPERFDREFLNRMDKIGIRGLSYDLFLTIINKIFVSPAGTMETIKAGKYAHLTLVTLTILGEKKKEKVVLIATRGERI